MGKRKSRSCTEGDRDRACETLLHDGLSRESKQCRHITSVDHGNIRDWLVQVLPAEGDHLWKVHLPATHDNSPSEHWPPEDNRQEVVKCLTTLTSAAPHKLDPTDMLDGACEQMAIQLSQEVASEMQGTNAAMDHLADSAQCLLKTQLTAVGAAEAVNRVFGHQSRIDWDQGPLLWQSVFKDLFHACTLSSRTVADVHLRTLEFLCGTTHAANHIKFAVGQDGPRHRVLPLYLLSYIFDANDIKPCALKEIKTETAQYSVHCVGLVFDTASRNVVVCVSNRTTARSPRPIHNPFLRIPTQDPNGAICPTANVEFIRLPLEHRKILTTNMSANDIALAKLST
jgi:hypothetical protein